MTPTKRTNKVPITDPKEMEIYELSIQNKFFGSSLLWEDPKKFSELQEHRQTTKQN